jgi:hypothetical protein
MAKKRPSESAAAPEHEPRSVYWRRQIEAWSASGLTQAEFCRRCGLSLASLRWWKWKLKSSAAATKSSSSARRSDRSTAGPKSPRFLPIRVVPPRKLEGRSSEPAELPTEVYELVLRGGHRLRVPADFDPAVLHRLILTVEATSC